MNQEQQLKLQAFLDGELPEREKRAILLWMQDDHEAAALLAELKSTRQAMVRSETRLKVTESREFFWSKIEREIQHLQPREISTSDISIFARLRRWLLPASALAALLAAGIIVHFYTPTAIIQNVADADNTPTVETTLASAEATTYRDASEGTTLVWFSDDAPARGKKTTAIN